MGRFTKPRTKVCRHLGMVVFNNSNVEKAFAKRETINFTRRKQSEYGIRLIEKQKIMFYYGLREGQMLRFFDHARHIKGDTGRNFLVLCERRLDNVVCVSGFANSRAAARQLVAHGHLLVNGRKCDIASRVLEVNDKITVQDKEQIRKLVDASLEARSGYASPDWLAVDAKTRAITVLRLPEREDVTLPVNEQLVVEFYSR
ncbi:MAG: 30S ribosomal protein S4 [Planctomycetota bacterium]|jgi:small subunit ribosomal protein S4|nr:30S ribosomal protein S4 [Planctomycetota bacterium]